MTMLLLLSRRFQRHIKLYGWRRTFRACAQNLWHSSQPIDDFDRINGTDTGRSVPLWKLKINNPDVKYGVKYQSAPESGVIRLLSEIPRDSCLVDLGCGRGKVLIIASRLGFQRVIGVDFSAELLQSAHRNLSLAHAAAELVCQSAGEYQFPQGPLAVFLYNPFGREVMVRVIEALRRHEGAVWVAYLNANATPGCRELLDEHFGPATEVGQQGYIWSCNR